MAGTILYFITLFFAAFSPVFDYTAAAPLKFGRRASELKGTTLFRRYDPLCIDQIPGAGEKAALEPAKLCKDQLIDGPQKSQLLSATGDAEWFVCERDDVVVTIKRGVGAPDSVASIGSDIGLGALWSIDHCSDNSAGTTGGSNAANGNGDLIVTLRKKKDGETLQPAQVVGGPSPGGSNPTTTSDPSPASTSTDVNPPATTGDSSSEVGPSSTQVSPPASTGGSAPNDSSSSTTVDPPSASETAAPNTDSSTTGLASPTITETPGDGAGSSATDASPPAATTEVAPPGAGDSSGVNPPSPTITTAPGESTTDVSPPAATGGPGGASDGTSSDTNPPVRTGGPQANPPTPTSVVASCTCNSPTSTDSVLPFSSGSPVTDTSIPAPTAR